jgi:hypothetical protein
MNLDFINGEYKEIVWAVVIIVVILFLIYWFNET